LLKAKEKEMEHTYMQLEASMLVIGQKERKTAKEFWIIPIMKNT